MKTIFKSLWKDIKVPGTVEHLQITVGYSIPGKDSEELKKRYIEIRKFLFMKRTVVFLSLSFFLLQFLNAQRFSFLRIYNSSGKKISKGHLFDTTDTSIMLSKGAKGIMYMETPITKVDHIKTNRTVTRRIINTTLSIIGVAVITIAVIYNISRRGGNSNWLLNNNRNRNKARKMDKNQNEIVKPLKPLKKYEVNSNLETWRTQRVLLHRLL